MDGRDPAYLRSLFDVTVEVGDPVNLGAEGTCPRCGYDAVLEFPIRLVSRLGVSDMTPTRACMRCYQETDDLEASVVECGRCEACTEGVHLLCMQAPGAGVLCSCALARHDL